MKPLLAEVEGIIRDLAALQSQPRWQRDPDDPFPLPRMIGVGDGGSLVVSKGIDDTIAGVARRLMADGGAVATTYTSAEWSNLVRKAFGPALASIDLDHDVSLNASAVLSEVRATLQGHARENGQREMAFGCTLFSNVAVRPFSVGPVTFEPRLAWLDRKFADGEVTHVTRRRVARAWRGEALRKRKGRIDPFRENDILKAVGKCDFVCSVATDGLATEAARERALTAARLATAVIALLWQTSSKALEGFNLLYDRTMHNRTALSFIPGKIVLAGMKWSHPPHGPWMPDGAWEQKLLDYPEHFTAATEVLNYVVHPTGAVARPKLMNALAQSLLWFHEGCRDDTTLMAIVKFSAALDALACGTQENGIRQLLKARLGLEDQSPIRADGLTLKKAVHLVYSDARSRTVHGTNDRLAHDWSGVRGLAEQLARYGLMTSLLWGADNPLEDDPEMLRA